jgi:hypothetical protein
MCLPPTAERLLLLHEAGQAADQVLEGFLRLPVTKALDLGSPEGFDRAAALLAARLRRAVGKADADAVRAASAA